MNLSLSKSPQERGGFFLKRCLGRMSQNQKERDSQDSGGTEPGQLWGLLPLVSLHHTGSTAQLPAILRLQ